METLKEVTSALEGLALNHRHQPEPSGEYECIYCECLVDVAATMTAAYIRDNNVRQLSKSIPDIPLGVVARACAQPRTSDVGP